MTSLTELLGRPAWQEHAACRGIGTDLFFPPHGDPNHRWKEAKKICEGCLVRAECLEFGLMDRVGVWGGMTEKERRAERIRRGLPKRGARNCLPDDLHVYD